MAVQNVNKEFVYITDFTASLKNWDKGFKIGHLNIRSLVKNIDQLRIYLSNQEYDICINKINNYEVSIDGYDLVRKDRKRTGGGVAMYIETQ